MLSRIEVAKVVAGGRKSNVQGANHKQTARVCQVCQCCQTFQASLTSVIIFRGLRIHSCSQHTGLGVRNPSQTIPACQGIIVRLSPARAECHPTKNAGTARKHQVSRHPESSRLTYRSTQRPFPLIQPIALQDQRSCLTTPLPRFLMFSSLIPQPCAQDGQITQPACAEHMALSAGAAESFRVIRGAT